MLKLLTKLKLKTQLLIIFTAMFIFLIFSFTYLHYLNEQQILDIVEGEINELSNAIQVSFEQITADGPTDEARLNEYIGRLKKKGIKEISIMNNEQEVIASTNPRRKGTKLSVSRNEFVIRTVLGEEGGVNKKMYNVILPVVVRNTQMGYVHISMYVDDLESLSRELFVKRLFITIVIFGIGFLLSILISNRFTRPISDLIKGAKEIVDGRLKPFESEYSGELAELVSSFNEMVVKLKEKMNIQEQLKKSEQQALLGQLASGIAHELRNPLNFINLSLDHVVTKLKKDEKLSPQELDEWTKRMKTEIARINQMLDNFLNLSRELKLYPVKIRGDIIIEDVIALLSHRLSSQNIEVIKEYTGNIPELYIDIDKMKSCFLNILNNSIDAMPDGGVIKILVKGDNDVINYIIEDNGTGIAEEDIKKVFEPYFSTKKNGIGIGLTLTRRIIEAHGGKISVASRTGKGTTVNISLPLRS